MRSVWLWLSSLLLVTCLAGHAVAQAPGDFAAWVQGLRQDAMGQGITASTLDRALAGVAPIPHIIELDHTQPETTLTFQQYMDRVVTQTRRDNARQHYADNKDLLDAVAQRYGVQPNYIVALWGIETDFGRTIGTYPEVAALATLAFDGRRAGFFRKELINALRIIQTDNIDPKAMLGSWAGAMGQSQFMPSSFLAYAVSYAGDGPPDIWTKPQDVFASIGNYLSQLGWHGDQGWGEPVTLPAGFDSSLIGMPQKRTTAEWSALGVRRADGSALGGGPQRAAILQPGGGDGPSYAVYDNFNVILRWNNSSYFAVAVGTLADSIN
jgi:membrane-bound lytic murein transglycosylase B